MGQQAVRVCEAGVRQRVLRILDERPLEEIERAPKAFLGALIQVIAALEVQVVCGEVL